MLNVLAARRRTSVAPEPCATVARSGLLTAGCDIVRAMASRRLTLELEAMR